MFVQTYRSERHGGIFTVYRDKDRSACVTHYVQHRGGCLYQGEVRVACESTLMSFSFSTTSPPVGRRWRAYGTELLESPRGQD